MKSSASDTRAIWGTIWGISCAARSRWSSATAPAWSRNRSSRRSRGALQIWERVAALNREIDEKKPWELNKQGRNAELDALLYVLCEGLRWLALLLHPFMPEKATQMWRQLGLEGEPQGKWAEESVWGKLAGGTRVASGEALFPRLEPQPA